jgi:hypothetical protein
VRLDASNAEVWSAFEEMERAHGSAANAARVWERAEAAARARASDAEAARPTVDPATLPTRELQSAALAAQEMVNAASQRQQQQAQQKQAQQDMQRNGWGGVERPRERTKIEAAFGTEPPRPGRRA